MITIKKTHARGAPEEKGTKPQIGEAHSLFPSRNDVPPIRCIHPTLLRPAHRLSLRISQISLPIISKHPIMSRHSLLPHTPSPSSAAIRRSPSHLQLPLVATSSGSATPATHHPAWDEGDDEIEGHFARAVRITMNPLSSSSPPPASDGDDITGELLLRPSSQRQRSSLFPTETWSRPPCQIMLLTTTTTTALSSSQQPPHRNRSQ